MQATQRGTKLKLRQSKYEEELMKIAGQMSEIVVRMKDIQTQTAYGNTGPSRTNGFTSMGNKNIMEYRSILTMEKLTEDAKGFSIWTLRLKSTLKQVRPVHSTL